MRKLILLYSICIALFTACGDSVVSPEQIEKYPSIYPVFELEEKIKSTTRDSFIASTISLAYDFPPNTLRGEIQQIILEDSNILHNSKAILLSALEYDINTSCFIIKLFRKNTTVS